MGAVANVVTVWRPSHKEKHEKVCQRLYQWETLFSSIIIILLAIINLVLKAFIKKIGISWSDWTALALGAFP